MNILRLSRYITPQNCKDVLNYSLPILLLQLYHDKMPNRPLDVNINTLACRIKCANNQNDEF